MGLYRLGLNMMKLDKNEAIGSLTRAYSLSEILPPTPRHCQL